MLTYCYYAKQWCFLHYYPFNIALISIQAQRRQPISLQFNPWMVTSSVDLTYVTLTVGWGRTDYQDVIVLSVRRPYWSPLLHSDLGPCLYLVPAISTENAITATSPGTRSTRSSRSRLGIKKSWPRLPHHTQRWVYTRGGRKFTLRVNRVLGWNHVYDTNNKKVKVKKVLKKDFLISTLFWFPLRLSYLCGRLPFRCFEGEH